jgi:hypothetical protein
MYRSLPGIVEGWSKNLARASRHTVDPWLRPAVPWLVAAFFIIFWVVPAIALVTSPFTATVSFGWALAAVLASLVFWIWIHRRLSVPVVTALLYPLGAIMVAFLFMRSALMGDTVKWRGRTYGGLSG